MAMKKIKSLIKKSSTSAVVVFACAAIIIFAASAMFATIDEEIEAKEREREELIRRIEELNASMNLNHEISNEINRRISETNAAIAALDAEIELITGDIADTELEIEKKTEEVAEYERKLKEKQELLNKRLRVMYKAGTVGYLEVLFGADSMQELLSRADVLQKIVMSDQNMISDLEEHKRITEIKKNELDYEKKQLVYLLDQRIEKKEKQRELLDDLYAYALEAKQDREALEEQYAMRMAEQAEIERVLEQLEMSKMAYVGGSMVWPVPSSFVVSSPYGYRPELVALGAPAFHQGVDIPGDYDASVLAAQSGIVMTATYGESYGRMIVVDHGGGIATLYAHLNSIYVEVGQEVTVGEVIGGVGNTGFSFGPHLHFEVRINGDHTDPMEYIGGYLE